MLVDKPDGIVHLEATKDEERAINATIISRTVTIQTKQSYSLEAPIFTY